jgi:hypothetical protein
LLNETQVISITDFSAGALEAGGRPAYVAGGDFGLFAPVLVQGAASGGSGGMASGSYVVSVLYTYDGVVTRISHDPSLGCLVEAPGDSADMFGLLRVIHPPVQTLQNLRDIAPGKRFHLKSTFVEEAGNPYRFRVGLSVVDDGDHYIVPTNNEVNSGAWVKDDSTQFFSGAAVPANTWGENGDYFIIDDEASPDLGRVYQKNSGVWGYAFNLRGPQGAVGGSYATTDADFVQPANGADVVVDLVAGEGDSLAVGQKVYVVDSFGSKGYYDIQATTANTVTFRNLNYSGSAAPGDTITAPARIYATGEQGLKGDAGDSAFTTTAFGFTQPNVGQSIQITLTGSNGVFGLGQYVFVSDGVRMGTFQVTATSGANLMTITNLGYPNSAAAGATFSAGASVTAAGTKGDAGAAGAITGASEVVIDHTAGAIALFRSASTHAKKN